MLGLCVTTVARKSRGRWRASCTAVVPPSTITTWPGATMPAAALATARLAVDSIDWRCAKSAVAGDAGNAPPCTRCSSPSAPSRASRAGRCLRTRRIPRSAIWRAPGRRARALRGLLLSLGRQHRVSLRWPSRFENHCTKFLVFARICTIPCDGRFFPTGGRDMATPTAERVRIIDVESAVRRLVRAEEDHLRVPAPRRRLAAPKPRNLRPRQRRDHPAVRPRRAKPSC